jgi:hypothetical protein
MVTSKISLVIKRIMKIIKSDRKISSFGGILPVLKFLRDSKMPELIRECLGVRVKQAKYSYEDVLTAWMLTNFCGGYRLDHITSRRKHLNVLPDLKLPSHDTLGRVMKKFVIDISIVYSEKSTDKKKKFDTTTNGQQININEPMNKLLIKSTMQLGLLKSGDTHTLDLDVTVVPNECYDAKMSYKRTRAYAPMIVSIGQLPIFIENRNGNVAAMSRILENVETSVNILKEHNIQIDKIRMDSGGYSLNAMKYMDDEGILFYIGAKRTAGMMREVARHKKWKRFQLETTQTFWDCEAADVPFRMVHGKLDYRLVVMRVKMDDNDKPTKWLPYEGYAYRIIITNDWTSSIEEIVTFHNARGAVERCYDSLKNNFGFRLPPFSNMNENSVFMLIAALTNNVYQALISRVSKKFKKLSPVSRLRDFIQYFMTVSLEIIDGTPVFYDVENPYEKFC